MLRNTLIFCASAFIILALFVIGEQTFSPSFQKCIGQHQTTDTENAAKNNPTGFSSNLRTYGRCSGQFFEGHHGGITALATIVIAAFTMTLWFATKQLREDGERHSERELRAYVAAIPVGLMRISPDERMNFFFLMQNGGSTPAHDVRCAAVIRILNHPLTAETPFPVLPIPASIFVLAPNIPMGGNAVADNEFTQEQIIECLRAPAQGGRRLYIFGQIDYVDAFGQPRWTRFCVSFPGRHDLIPFAQQGNWDTIAQIIAQPPSPISGGNQFSFEWAEQHNQSS